jgi:hypothetical protein
MTAPWLADICVIEQSPMASSVRYGLFPRRTAKVAFAVGSL